MRVFTQGKLEKFVDENKSERKRFFLPFADDFRVVYARINVTNLITTVNINSSNTMQRSYDIFINNRCLFEVTFVA